MRAESWLENIKTFVISASSDKSRKNLRTQNSSQYTTNTQKENALNHEEEIQLLGDLGLTLLQAKAYLALSRLGNATIKAISKTSNIARQDAYRIMPILQNQGLAERIISSPVLYKATPIKTGISMLLQRKTEKHAELQKKTIEILNNFRENNVKEAPQESDSEFAIISERTLLFNELKNSIQATQTSIKVAGILSDANLYLGTFYKDWQRAMKRGVKIQVLTEKPEETPRIGRVLAKNPLFEVKYITTPLQVYILGINDMKEVYLNIAVPLGRGSRTLWSNNPSFVSTMAAYFEELWENT